MTAILTADLHLDDNPVNEYRWQTCEAIIRYSQKVEADLAFILGDLTDSKDNHSAALVNRIVDLLPRFAPQVYVIRGNHDCIDPDKPFFRFIEKMPGLHFVNNPAYVKLPLADAAGTKRVLLVPNGKWHTGLLGDAKNYPALILMHETFDGADGGGHRLNGLPLPKTKVPIVSGDVHVPQTLGTVTYIGAPTLIDFGDDYEPRILKLGDTSKLVSVKLNTPTKRLVEATVSNQGVISFPKADALRSGDIIKMRLIFPEAPPSSERIQGCRDLAQIWAARFNLQLYSVEFNVPKGSLPVNRGAPQSDKELAITYAKAHGYDGATTKVGVDIVEGKHNEPDNQETH